MSTIKDKIFDFSTLVVATTGLVVWISYWIWWGVTANDVIVNIEWFGKINWFPGTYSNATYSSVMPVIVGGVSISTIVALVSLITGKWVLALIGCVSPIIILFTGPSIGAHSIASKLAFEDGTAREECWLPESFECHQASGLNTPKDAPRVWVDGALSEWASTTLEEKISNHVCVWNDNETS